MGYEAVYSNTILENTSALFPRILSDYFVVQIRRPASFVISTPREYGIPREYDPEPSSVQS